MYLKSIKSSNPSYCSQQSNLEAIKTLSRSLLINFWRDDFTNASTILDFDYFEIFQFHTIIFRISPNQIFVALEPQISKNLSWTFWRRPTYTKYRGFHTVNAKFINIVDKILNEYWLITWEASSLPKKPSIFCTGSQHSQYQCQISVWSQLLPPNP